MPIDLRSAIGQTLRQCANQPCAVGVNNLLEKLGYHHIQTIGLADSQPQTFLDFLRASNPETPFNETKALCDHWVSADLLVPITEQKVPNVDPGMLRSPLFCALELRSGDYPRDKLTDITRQIQRMLPMPVMVFMKHLTGDKKPVVSIAVIHQRQHQLDGAKERIAHVRILRNISLLEPHCGHVEILHSLAWKHIKHPDHLLVDTIDRLHEGWDPMFDVDLLHAQFYREIMNWYFWALHDIGIDVPEGMDKAPHRGKATLLMRLLTRIFFCWCLKEKGVASPELFHETVGKTMTPHMAPDESTYCQAILKETSYLESFAGDAEIPVRAPNRLFFADIHEADGSPAQEKSKRKEKKVRGLLHILHSYPFTMVENTLTDQDVALDPEVLGTVLENLLASYNENTTTTARKQTGTFYTSRAIVDSMVDEVLKAHLTAALVHKGLEQQAARSGIDWLFSDTEPTHPLGEHEVTWLLEALRTCKILDPACGSGAFHVGVLHKLGFVLRKLDPDHTRWTPLQVQYRDPEFGRKLHWINHCLYGVDIEPVAIQIAKLRLFLALLGDGKVDEEPHDGRVRHILHLKTNFVVTDALLALAESNFDIVIGNPPYVEFKKLAPEAKRLYEPLYASASGKYDIFVLFIERAAQLLRTNGLLCFIIPTTFLRKDFGQGIRRYIAENLRPLLMHDFGNLQMFDGPTNYTGIFLFMKAGVNPTASFPFHRYKQLPGGRAASADLAIEALSAAESMPFKDVTHISQRDLMQPTWDFQSSSVSRLLRLIAADHATLKDCTTSIFQGIASGKDEVFYVDAAQIEEFHLEQELLKPLLKGRDIKKYAVNWSGTFVVYPYDDESRVMPEAALAQKYPRALQYLRDKRALLGGRPYFDRSSKEWFELWNQRKRSNFETPRLVTPEISDRNHFARTTEFYGNTKTYHLIPSDDSVEYSCFLLALLNSSTLEYYYKSIATPQAGGFFAYKTAFLERIPIKKPEPIELHVFSRLVPCIELAKQTAEFGAQLSFLGDLIDACVMECYLREHMAARDLLFLDELAPHLDKYDAHASASKQCEFVDDLVRTLQGPRAKAGHRLQRMAAESPDLLAMIMKGGKA